MSLMTALRHDLTRSFEKTLRAVWLISRLVLNYNTVYQVAGAPSSPHALLPSDPGAAIRCLAREGL